MSVNAQYDRYQKFRKAYHDFHQLQKWTEEATKQVSAEWQAVKKNPEKYDLEMKKYTSSTKERDSGDPEGGKGRKRTKAKKSDVLSEDEDLAPAKKLVAGTSKSPKRAKKTREPSVSSESSVSNEPTGMGIPPPLPQSPTKKKVPAKEQEKMAEKISLSSKLIASLETMKAKKMLNKSSLVSLKEHKKNMDEAARKLKRLEQNRLYQERHRQKKKALLAQVMEKHPELQDDLSGIMTRDTPGRPSLETLPENAHLRRVIQELVTKDANDSSDGTLQAGLTLDNLVEALAKEGMTVSRSAAYLRLLPRRVDSREGKRHTNSLPVKLGKAAHEPRLDHVDSQFASRTIEYLKELPELLGGNQVFFLSQDDKARVSLDMPKNTTMSSQMPILLKWEYSSTAPDSPSDRHRLMPTVYAARVVSGQRQVTYAGPTYVSVRSGRHEPGSARSNSADFLTLVRHQAFTGVATMGDGQAKPIVVLMTDNGPNNCPRFEDVIHGAVHVFRACSLDALFVAAHAPGHAAYNAVERRMAPLAKDLTGVILPYEEFGLHLDETGKTVDDEMEKDNLKRVAECLCEVWGENMIDDHPVAACFAEKCADDLADYPTELDAEWRLKHVRTSQYLTQIVKCGNRDCCPAFRTRYASIFPERFLPGPICYTESPIGIVPADGNTVGTGYFGSFLSRLAQRGLDPQWKFGRVPYDFYCPSLWPANVPVELERRTCPACRLYDASEAGLAGHHCVPVQDVISEFLTLSPCIQAGPQRAAAGRVSDGSGSDDDSVNS